MSEEKKLLFKHDEQWDADKLHLIWAEIEEIAKELEISYYPPQFEVISAEQMIDAYTSVAMPVMYRHWSFGKAFIQQNHDYQEGRMGLAYEVVINSNPAIAYLMESNSITMMALVMAHASVGHSAVFKNNYLFKLWTDADGIIDYLVYAKNYIKKCEEHYGDEAVERVLDAAHSIQQYGVDKYKRKTRNKTSAKKMQREIDRHQQKINDYDDLWEKTVPKMSTDDRVDDDHVGQLEEPEENLLYFIEKNAPTLPTWKREIIRIVRRLATYWYPQGQCLTGNHMVSTQNGFHRLRDLIGTDGYHRNNEIRLLSADNTFQDISHTYLNRSQRVMRVTTKSGRVWTATPEHPLNALDKQRLISETRCIRDLRVGDYLTMEVGSDAGFSSKLVNLSTPSFEDEVSCYLCDKKTQYLPTHLATHGISTDEYSGKLSSGMHRLNKSKNQPTKYPTVLDENMSRLLGYLTDATLGYGESQSSVRFTSTNDAVLDDIRFLLNECFGISVDVKLTEHEVKEIRFNSYGIKCFVLANFEYKKFGKHRLHVPDQILKSPKNVVANFIKAVVDIKSSVRTSVSDFRLPAIIDDIEDLEVINTLLISMGIVARIKRPQPDTIHNMAVDLGIDTAEDEDTRMRYDRAVLSVYGTYRERWNQYIGSVRADLPLTENSRISTDDVIPGAMELFNEIRQCIRDEESHWKKCFDAENKRIGFYVAKSRGQLRSQQKIAEQQKLPPFRNNEISQIELERYSDQLEYMTRECGKYESCVKFNRYINSARDKFYDEIVSIETLDDLHDVYDVTVPYNHLFYVDGIISHNTQIVNEGYATFTHHYIMNRLYERGLIDEGSFIEFIANHTGVITQHDYDSKYYSGFNVYTVGFNIFRDLKRMCEHPTDEDREWFPDIVGKRWQDVINNAMKNYNNETFINQFLSPKVMRDMKLFAVLDSYHEKDYVVSGIHDEQGYRTVREIFARQYNRSRHVPDIAVIAADMNGSRELVLFHNDINDVPLDERSATQVLQYVAELWEYDVRLETISLSSRGAANKDILVKGPNSEVSKLRVSPRDPYFSPETD